MRNLTGKVTRASALVALAVTLLFSAALQARAQDDDPAPPRPESPPHRRRGGDGVDLLQRLNLTPEQIDQIRGIRRTSESEGHALLRRVSAARRALDEAIYADQADEALVQERARELAEAQAAVTRMRAQVEWRIRNVLTPAQLSTLRELRQQMRRERIERRRDAGRPRREPGDAADDSAPPFPRPRRRGLFPRP